MVDAERVDRTTARSPRWASSILLDDSLAEIYRGLHEQVRTGATSL